MYCINNNISSTNNCDVPIIGDVFWDHPNTVSWWLCAARKHTGYPLVICDIAIEHGPVEIYNEFSHEQWWFSIVMYINVYQMVFDVICIFATANNIPSDWMEKAFPADGRWSDSWVMLKKPRWRRARGGGADVFRKGMMMDQYVTICHYMSLYIPSGSCQYLMRMAIRMAIRLHSMGITVV